MCPTAGNHNAGRHERGQEVPMGSKFKEMMMREIVEIAELAGWRIDADHLGACPGSDIAITNDKVHLHLQDRGGRGLHIQVARLGHFRDAGDGSFVEVAEPADSTSWVFRGRADFTGPASWPWMLRLLLSDTEVQP